MARRKLKLFGREREELFVEKARAGRAVYQGRGLESEVEVTLLTEDDGKLVLRMTPATARTLLVDLHTSYTAINPPIRFGNANAEFQGMDLEG